MELAVSLGVLRLLPHSLLKPLGHRVTCAVRVRVNLERPPWLILKHPSAPLLVWRDTKPRVLVPQLAWLATVCSELLCQP